MQDLFGSVRRSIVFRTIPDNNLITDGNSQQNQDTHLNNTNYAPPFAGALVEKLNSCIRKSRVFSKPVSNHSPPPSKMSPAIRWRKGELIGCGAFGSVYMGMNLDSGELLAVKQVLVAANNASKEKTQAHIKELEEEVKLLKDLSHPNIVRYLGTVREENSLNILLEFVPGGSISSLLGKFGPFPETVVRTYTEQLLLGLQYLHSNGIMHRDIKGANILVDNKGCIKLADFGASKQVVELATDSGAKSMKGTPYWMAPEVIRQTGHSFSADIWSVGCTVIEMATGKPPWSQQYQEVAAALFHIGTTKSHPPIPDHLSVEAKDFLLKCLQEEPSLRPTASELLKHPFVIGLQVEESHPISSTSFMINFGVHRQEGSEVPWSPPAINLDSLQMARDDLCNLGNLSCSTTLPKKWATSHVDEDMCQLDKDGFSPGEGKLSSVLMADDLNKSRDPVCEPRDDDWRCIEERILEPVTSGPSLSEDDDELTESKIKAFLDEKALELKKLQTPLYEEFYNSLNSTCTPSLVERVREETSPNYLKLPPKSQSPNGVRPSLAADSGGTIGSPGSNGKRVSNVGIASEQTVKENSSPQRSNWKESSNPNMSFSERQRKWKEELDEELDILRQKGIGGKTSSPKDRVRQRDRTRFASPGK